MRPPDSWRRARVTIALMAAMAVAWLLISSMGRESDAAIWAGFIPARADGSLAAGSLALLPVVLTPLGSLLLHSGFIHLALNLLMLAVCGRSVENILGPVGLAILVVLGAYVAAAGYYLQAPGGLQPLIGAGGPVAAILGAYAMLFGRNRVKVANHRLAFWLNALWLAAAWVGLQVLVGLTFQSVGAKFPVVGLIAAFLVGMALAKPLLLLRYRGA